MDKVGNCLHQHGTTRMGDDPDSSVLNRGGDDGPAAADLRGLPPSRPRYVVEFLADPDSALITGQIYSVNGGQYM